MRERGSVRIGWFESCSARPSRVTVGGDGDRRHECTLGGSLDADGVIFVPYRSPRIVLDALFDDNDQGDDSDLDLEFALDLGVDIYFRRGWGIRLGGTLVEREAVAVGIIF